MSDTHEPAEELAARDRDIHRALTSLKEEIEAIDWYHQRVSLAVDESLRQVLAHNRDEEIEHASMMLEWLRRNMEPWDRELSNYLFSQAKLTEVDQGKVEGLLPQGRPGPSSESSLTSDGSLGIRGLPPRGPGETLP